MQFPVKFRGTFIHSFAALPHGARGLSAVCDCGIS